MIKETVDSMLGERVDTKLAKKLKKSICEVPGVYGVYDLFIHNYGPEDIQGSVHIKVDDSLTAVEIQKLTRIIATKIYEEYSIILTAIGIYAKHEKHEDIQRDLAEITSKYPGILETHGFIVYEDENLITFDMIVDFEHNREEIKNDVISEIKSRHPKYNFLIIDDYDTSDINKNIDK